MKQIDILTFSDFKSEYCIFYGKDEYWRDSLFAVFGCNEETFETWLKKQNIVKKRYINQIDKPLCEFSLTLDKWDFFIEHFEREMRRTYIIRNYPSGYFEAVRDDGQVACFLPDTYGKQPYRLSFYRKTGPIHHEAYSSRDEALGYLATRGYKAEKGALDRLVGTVLWDRGVQVCQWIAEGISPQEGLLRDKHKSEVSRLFI